MIIYLDHPVGEANGEDSVRRQDNIAHAGDWFVFLMEISRWVVVAPWYVYAVRSVSATRYLVDSTIALERCDLYCMCGGVIAPHMQIKMRTSRRLGLPILDMTPYGVLPPPVDENIKQVISAKVNRLITNSLRRVWMPLLTSKDVAALTKLRRAIETHLGAGQGSFEESLDVVDRILDAASRHDRFVPVKSRRRNDAEEVTLVDPPEQREPGAAPLPRAQLRRNKATEPMPGPVDRSTKKG